MAKVSDLLLYKIEIASSYGEMTYFKGLQGTLMKGGGSVQLTSMYQLV
jgi:hypothetical protein